MISSETYLSAFPTDLATYGDEAKNLLTDLQSRNERMFLVTIIVMNTAKTKQKLENSVFATAGIAQKFNCALKRLDYQQEQGLMSSLPMGLNQIEIQRGLTTSSTAIFVPFTTQELFMRGAALYYVLNALSNNLIMADRKKLKNPKGLYCKGTGNPRKTQAVVPFAAQMDGHPQEKGKDRNISYPHLPCSIAEKFQKDFEKGSVLPPVFDLLVRGCNPIPPASGYALKTRGRRRPTIFYTAHTQNTI